MPFDHFLADMILETTLKGAAWEHLDAVQLALWIGSPGATGMAGAEVSGNGYARVIVGTGDWGVVGSGTVQNTSVIAFPEATGLWGTVDYISLLGFQIFSFAYFFGALAEAKEIDEGAVPKFQIGDLTVTLT